MRKNRALSRLDNSIDLVQSYPKGPNLRLLLERLPSIHCHVARSCAPRRASERTHFPNRLLKFILLYKVPKSVNNVKILIVLLLYSLSKYHKYISNKIILCILVNTK
jgi:hypothetical protein